MRARPAASVAKVRAKNAGAAFDGGGRKVQRVILPSLHVAGFVHPCISELIEMQEDALISTAGGSRADGNAIIVALRKSALKKLLKGFSAGPVPVLWRSGVDVEAVKAEAVKAIEEAREKAASAAEAAGKSVDAVLAAMPSVEDVVASAEVSAEDREAMAAAAALQPVTDWTWDAGESYLSRIQNAQLGSLEASDWAQLNRAAADFVQELVQLAGAPEADPKARARIRLSLS